MSPKCQKRPKCIAANDALFDHELRSADRPERCPSAWIRQHSQQAMAVDQRREGGCGTCPAGCAGLGCAGACDWAGASGVADLTSTEIPKGFHCPSTGANKSSKKI